MDISSEFVEQIFYAALINTVIVFGILQTAKKIFISFFELDKSKYVGIILTYTVGFLCTVYMSYPSLFTQLLTGLAIGCLSTAMYKSVGKQILNLPERIIDKIFK